MNKDVFKNLILGIVRFLSLPWVNIICAISGYVILIICFHDYTSFDKTSALIGSLSFVFMSILDYGLFNLKK